MVDVQIVLCALIMSVFLKNLFNIGGVTAVSHLFSVNGILGILMGWILLFYILLNQVEQGKVFDTIHAVTIAAVVVNSGVNGLMPVFSLTVMLYCIYMLQIMRKQKWDHVIEAFFALGVGFEVQSLVILISKKENIGALEKLISSIVMDIFFVICVLLFIYRKQILSWKNVPTIKKTLFLLTTIGIGVGAVTCGYSMFVMKFIQIMPKYQLYCMVITLIALMCIVVQGTNNQKEIYASLYSKVDADTVVSRLINVICVILIFTIYTININVQDGAINGAYHYEWYGKMATLLRLSSPAGIYRIVVVLNAVCVIFQFWLIKKVYFIVDNIIDSHFKKRPERRNENNRIGLSSIVAFAAVLIPELLCLSGEAENIVKIAFATAFWLFFYFAVNMLVEEDVKYFVGSAIGLICIVMSYIQSIDILSSIPNLMFQIVLILGALIVIYCWETGVGMLYEKYFGTDLDENDEPIENVACVMKIPLVTYALMSISFCFVLKGIPIMTHTVNVHDTYDNIQSALDEVRSLAYGELYYDSTVDENIKFVIENHMLCGTENTNLDYAAIDTIFNKTDDLEQKNKTELKKIEKEKKGRFNAAIEILTTDGDGYRVIHSDEVNIAQLIVESQKYHFVDYIGEYGILCTQNADLISQLWNTDYHPKTIKYLTMDDLQLNLDGLVTKYEGVEPEELPREGSKVEGYIFGITILGEDYQDIALYNKDKFSLDYHLYQNGELVSFDHQRVNIPSWNTYGETIPLTFDIKNETANNENLIKFDPEKEFEIQIDVVHEGLTWLSLYKQESTITFIHHVNGTWSVKE